MIQYFRRYMSLKKFGQEEVDGIEFGKAYVYPKLDGTNSQVWHDGEQIQAGSRNRQLTLENDNAGFYKSVIEDEKLHKFFTAYPNLRLIGEYLVPHTLKTYEKEAWNKFYVFDVIVEYDVNEETDHYRYMTYDEYKPILEHFGIEYIAPIAIIENGTEEHFTHFLSQNNYLIQDGKGNGEGIVIKNYQYKNKFGKIVWAKIITNEFKDKHRKAMGPIEMKATSIESKVVDKYVSSSLIEKEYAKIILEVGEWNKKLIPRLLETVFYCLITEEFYTAVKKEKISNINMKSLRNLTIAKIVETKPELFS